MGIYLLVINGLTFTAFGMDKYQAVRHKSRIRVRTLLMLSSIGGAAGALLAMYTFRHKIRKKCFAIGVPLMLILQCAGIYYFMIIKK